MFAEPRRSSQPYRTPTVIFWTAVALLSTGSAQAVVFAGEVQIDDAQVLFTPASNFSPVVLRFYAPDGAHVDKGDVVLRIDAAQAASQVRTLTTQLAQLQPKIAKEVADLELKVTDAELAAVDAKAAYETAAVDAGLPRALVSALDFDRYQAESERTRKDAELKAEELVEARLAVTRRQSDGALEARKLQDQIDFYQLQADAAEVRAERPGIVVHGFSTISFNGVAGGRIDEGSSSYPGNRVGMIVDSGTMSVRAYLLEPDRGALARDARVRLTFDALPGVQAGGRIRVLSGASQAKTEWGSGRYFVADIDIDSTDAKTLALKPGMSVRVEAGADLEVAMPVGRAPSSREKIEAAGDVYARSTATIAPPIVDDLWELTVSQMARDGATVKRGEMLVTFDGGELPKSLAKSEGELAEKQRTLEKLRLELAEKARTATLATAEAHADAIKAARKAEQPEAYVPGVQFRKLVIARQKAERHETVTRAREVAAAHERDAELAAAQADVAHLAGDVKRLHEGLDQLVVVAPRDGLFVHAANYRGEKVDVGSQVWRGASVGEIPDTTTLAVRATLPEGDASRVRPGDAARILVEGGSGQSIAGHIADIGRTVHSKSRVEPVPVIDLIVTFDAATVTLKPGQPVRVELADATGRI